MEYWKGRYEQQGPVYVARHGMTPEQAAGQAGMFRKAIDRTRGRVLDYGCGVGRLAAYLSETAHEYVGMDICEGALEFARKAHGSNNVLFEPASGLHLLPDGYFDLTVCCTVLQHVPDEDIDRVMAQLKRVTKGRFCIIDSAEFDSTAEHMFPREPREFTRWLDLQEPIKRMLDVDHRGSHYVLTGRAATDIVAA
ncbi:MAG: class I SAM-dependent methyltransferase [Phycisphaerales bacterium JB064]